MERTIHCRLSSDGTPQVRVPLYAGVAGEHNTTTLTFEGDNGSFYDEAQLVRILFGGGDGAVVSTDLLTVETDASGWHVSYVLPLAMTALGGQITARLVLSVIENGEEVQTAMSGAVVLFLDDSTMEQGTPFWTAVSQMLHRTVSAGDYAATEAAASAAAAEASRNALVKSEAAVTDASDYAKLAMGYRGAAESAKKDAERAAEQAAASAVNAMQAAGMAVGAKTMHYKGEVTTAELFMASSSAVVGDVYVNTDTGEYCLWTGNQWSVIASPSDGGADGKSAYQIWLDQGNVGTEADFIASLKGATGAQGADGQDYVLTDADKAQIASMVTVDTTPSYVTTEAARVADNILSVRTADTFVMACVSDLHTSGADASAVGVCHAGQAMSHIQSLTTLDAVAVLGDIAVGDFEESAADSFKFVKECFADIAKQVPYLHLQGNHDELPSDTTAQAQQRYYAFIGANNTGVVTDYANKFRNYGYRDFENYKVRVIYLNTADVSEQEMTYDNHITAAQMTWFVNTALRLSDKDDAARWSVIVCGHHPLNWTASGDGSVTKVLDVLDAFKGQTSGSVTVDGQSIAFDFSGETAELVCHIHGHLHNFREEVLGENGVLSVTVPNVCFGRNNEYGNYDYATYPDVVNRYGDDGAANDGIGTQRTFLKVSDTAADTAFSVFCIDKADKTLRVFNYGAGIDRRWNYESGVKGEVGDGGGDVTPSYTNRIPLSVNADDSAYVGANGEDGYNTEARINSSGVEAAQSGMCCTGFINLGEGAPTVRLKNVTVAGTKNDYIAIYNPDKSFQQVVDLNDKLPDDGNGVFTGTVPAPTSNCWIRITCGGIDEMSVLTLDEPIE